MSSKKVKKQEKQIRKTLVIFKDKLRTSLIFGQFFQETKVRSVKENKAETKHF